MQIASSSKKHVNIEHASQDAIVADLTCRELRLIGVGLGGDIDTTEPLSSFSLRLDCKKGARTHRKRGSSGDKRFALLLYLTARRLQRFPSRLANRKPLAWTTPVVEPGPRVVLPVDEWHATIGYKNNRSGSI